MTINILEALATEKINKLSRSAQASETFSRLVKDRADCAASIVSGDTEGSVSEAFMLRELYHQRLARYKRKITPLGPMNNRSKALWTRVAVACAKSQKPRETFIDAQFSYFDKIFKTAPTPVQLTTDLAIMRATSYDGQAFNSVTNNLAYTVDLGDLFSQCEKQMRDVMKAQKMTRQEVYTAFVKPGLIYFPQEYLKADPAWRSL